MKTIKIILIFFFILNGFQSCKSQNNKIEPCPCKKKFTIIPDGTDYYCRLAKDYEIYGSLIPEGSIFYAKSMILGENGYSINLYNNIKIKGYLVRHNGYGYRDLVFYKDGSLAKFYLAVNTEINNIPCKGDKRSTLWLDPEGILRSCTLAKEFEINNKKYPKNSLLVFNSDNTINYLSNNIKDIFLDHEGNIRDCKLNCNFKIDNITYKKGSRLHFYKDGKIRSGKICKDTEIDDVVYKKGSILYFNKDDNVIK